mgnify:CR=1 FL=1
MKKGIPIEVPSDSLTAYRIRNSSIEKIHVNTTTIVIGALSTQWVFLKEAQLLNDRFQEQPNNLEELECSARNKWTDQKEEPNQIPHKHIQSIYWKYTNANKGQLCFNAQRMFQSWRKDDAQVIGAAKSFLERDTSRRMQQDLFIINKLMINIREQRKDQERIIEHWNEGLVALETSHPSEAALLHIYTLTPRLKRLLNREGYKSLSDFGKPRFSLEVSERNTKLKLPARESIIYMEQTLVNESTHFHFTFLPETSTITNLWLFVLRRVINQKLEISRNLTLLFEPLELAMTIYYPLKKAENKKDHTTIYYNPEGYKIKNIWLTDYILSQVEKSIERLAILRKNILSESDTSFIKRLQQNKSGSFKLVDSDGYILNETDLSNFDKTRGSLRSKIFKFCECLPNATPFICTNLKTYQPYPVEGFLLRSYISRKAHFTMEYFFTIQNYLLFQPFQYADPLLSANSAFPSFSGISLSDFRDLVKSRDLKFQFSPYPIDKYHIRWLHPNILPSEFKRFDRIATKEMERKANMVLNALYLMDMGDIKEVIPISEDLFSKRTIDALNGTWIYPNNRHHSSCLKDTGLKIKKQDGSSILLIASCKEVRDDWIDQLLKTQKYWQQKKRFDTEKLQMDLMQKDMQIGTERTYRLEKITTHPRTVPENIDNVIIKADTLYFKNKKTSPFKKAILVLAYGFLILFAPKTSRNLDGSFTLLPYAKKILNIDLSYCYIYEGDQYTTQSYLNDMKPNKPYLEDTSAIRTYANGFKNSDEHGKRCFTLWYSKNISGDSKTSALDLSDHKKLEAILPVKVDNHIIFLTRSGDEKRSWIKNIEHIMELSN